MYYSVKYGKIMNTSFMRESIDKQTQNMGYKVLIKPDKSKIWIDDRYI